MKWEGHVARMGDAERVLKGRSENRRPLGKPRCRWKDNNKMHLQHVG
jgi:hypothetical protein